MTPRRHPQQLDSKGFPASGFAPWPVTEEMFDAAQQALGVMHLNREVLAKAYIAMRASEKEVHISDTSFINDAAAELLNALGYLLSVARASHIDVEDIAYAEAIYQMGRAWRKSSAKRIGGEA